MSRTFAIGDIHGDLRALETLLERLPELEESDTLVFVGDYVDRGPCSREVVDRVRALSEATLARVICLRGNHEDAWLRVVDTGWPEFVFPRPNGCLETYRSFTGGAVPAEDETPTKPEFDAMMKGRFFPADVVAWMRGLPFWYENEHAIFVHAGLPRHGERFEHPSEVTPREKLLWLRSKDFFENYRGKLIVFGHTTTEQLPPELSMYTPEDPTDLWAGPAAIGLDTGAGKGGFLTAVELPSRRVFESRSPVIKP
jgi:serine/threonine protein phosphatase 1